MVIYKITNTINNKVYIGKDEKNDPNYFGSGKLIKRAIKKHGISKFTKEIIETCENREQLIEREGYFVRNNICINKHIPGRTQKEYDIQIVTCECGVKLRKRCIYKHKKSKKHLDLISNSTLASI